MLPAHLGADRRRIRGRQRVFGQQTPTQPATPLCAAQTLANSRLQPLPKPVPHPSNRAENSEIRGALRRRQACRFLDTVRASLDGQIGQKWHFPQLRLRRRRERFAVRPWSLFSFTLSHRRGEIARAHTKASRRDGATVESPSFHLVSALYAVLFTANLLPVVPFCCWWRRAGSNRRPTGYESVALTI